jgi:hypothetical protein
VAQALKLKLEEIDMQPDLEGLEKAFQTAKQKQVGGGYDDDWSRLFRGKKTHR